MTATPRNQGIDLLRGVSIVLVVLLHIALRIPLSHTGMAAWLPMWLLAALCFNGAESVTVFFVVSGFLITGNALRRWGGLGQPQIRGFYARRAARILPCLVLLVGVLSLLDVAGVRGYTITRADQSLPRAILAALGFHLNLYEAYTGYLPASWTVLWSLSIEEVFYIGFPLACLLARRTSWPLVVMLLVLALSLPITRGLDAGNELLREQAYLPGMAAIATGVLAALGVRRWTPSRTLGIWMARVGGAGWLAIIVGEDWIWPFLGEGTLLILTIGTAVLLGGLHVWRPRLPGTWWLQAFGRLSYEVYLTHMFVVLPAIAVFRGAGMPDRLGWVIYPPILAGSLGLGLVVSRLISQPAEAWLGRKWRLPAVVALPRKVTAGNA